MYDVIVIGARCAGAPTAMLLARQGYHVLLVDRATFPSDIPHGHLIHRQGPQLLQRWGLLDRVMATNCPPISTFTSDYGDFPLIGTDMIVDGVALGIAPRRSALDQVLIDAAVDAGVEFRPSFSVQELVMDGEQVTGIRGRRPTRGALVTEHATVVVGADGRNSRVAKLVRAPSYDTTPPLTCYYFSYWSGVPDFGTEVYVRGRRAIFAFPTNDGLFAIFVAWPAGELETVRANIDEAFMAVIEEVPELAARVRLGQREEPWLGASDLPNFFRKPYGPGWALVGDAGCHKDPFMALGINDAFRDASFLASALDDHLTRREPFDLAMAGYERRRNEASRPDYMQNIRMAQFQGLPPDLIRIRAAVRGNQEATNQFFLAIQGLIPREAFFNRQNLERLLSASTTAV